MTSLTVSPGRPLRGWVQVPGDKSISHRAVLLSAIATGTGRITGFLPSGDCLATVGAVRALGVEIEEPALGTLLVRGVGLHGLREPAGVLDCARSGTAMRLLAGMLAAQPFLSILSGDSQLLWRPMGRVVEPLRLMGGTVLGRDGGRYPPLAIHGGPLHGIDYTLPVASAQVKSALLLAGLYADGPTTLREPNLSRDHTERMLRAMAARLRVGHREVGIEPTELLEALEISVPGDFSSAAYLAVAAALVPGSEVTIGSVGVNPTRTGLLDALRAMCADVAVENQRIVSGEPVADLVVRGTPLSGVQVGGEAVVRMIDEFPILAVAATQAQGETFVRDAAELRVKETDRIATVTDELRRMGAEIEALPDGFRVRGPTRLKGTAIQSHSDHRLAMALIVAGLVAQGETTVHGADCISDSFPGFQVALRRLGGELQ
jgi:3-phosphoshikimate 1-carboxyvinyltransferase